MKKIILISILLFSIVVFSQKRASKKVETTLNEIEISTEGLDDFIIENTTSNFIEIFLYAENANKQHIVFEEEDGNATLKFNLQEFKTENTVFRKFITKRLNRANAVVKIPKHLVVTILGDHVDVTSKSCQNKLQIFIEKGNVKLYSVKKFTQIKLYAGNVYAEVKNTNVALVSNIGIVKINGVLVPKLYKNKQQNTARNFTVNTIKANIFLTTK